MGKGRSGHKPNAANKRSREMYKAKDQRTINKQRKLSKELKNNEKLLDKGKGPLVAKYKKDRKIPVDFKMAGREGSFSYFSRGNITITYSDDTQEYKALRGDEFVYYDPETMTFSSVVSGDKGEDNANTKDDER